MSNPIKDPVDVLKSLPMHVWNDTLCDYYDYAKQYASEEPGVDPLESAAGQFLDNLNDMPKDDAVETLLAVIEAILE